MGRSTTGKERERHGSSTAVRWIKQGDTGKGKGKKETQRGKIKGKWIQREQRK